MKRSRNTLLATTIPLLLASLRVTADELPFNAPTTEQARESAPLLHQTARALDDSSSSAMLGLLGGKQISNLWLFPTADANTVFARYNLTSNKEAASGVGGSTTEHLAVLTVNENRIVQSRELTSPEAGLATKDYAGLDGSAAIGTGYAAHTDRTGFSQGIPASKHWTASIGTGTAAASSTGVSDAKRVAPSVAQPVVAVSHWTSRIGTGDAFDSNRPGAYASLADAR